MGLGGPQRPWDTLNYTVVPGAPAGAWRESRDTPGRPEAGGHTGDPRDTTGTRGHSGGGVGETPRGLGGEQQGDRSGL
jgi:hypothetical protein